MKFILPFVCCLLLVNSVPVLSNQDRASNKVAAVSTDYLIGVEDVLAINVWKEPELSVKEVAVRPDGKISFPLITEIQASGLTPKQLQEQLASRLKEYVAAPNVTVVVLKILSQSVSIVGQVSKPGIYILGSPITILELLARAGGLREEAKSKRIQILRKEGEKTKNYSFNYNEVSRGINLQQNIVLKNKDVIVVP
jgi:polysaccharide biosynthesis/export protein